MSSVIYPSLTVNYDNVKTYCSSNEGDFLQKDSSLGGKVAYEMYMNGTSQSLALTSAAKEILYPTPYAKPRELETNFNGRQAWLQDTTNSLIIDNNTVYSQNYTQESERTYSSGILNKDAIKNSTRNSNIQWTINVKYSTSVAWVRNFTIKLTYDKYYHSVAKCNDARGIANVLIATTNPNAESSGLIDYVNDQNKQVYNGDLVTYKALLNNSKSVWKGWYADREHTVLVSMDQEYTIEANSDYTLYAYAVQLQGVSYKINGEWKEGIVIWQRQNGYWREITKNEIPTDIGYEIQESQQNE